MLFSGYFFHLLQYYKFLEKNKKMHFVDFTLTKKNENQTDILHITLKALYTVGGMVPKNGVIAQASVNWKMRDANKPSIYSPPPARNQSIRPAKNIFLCYSKYDTPIFISLI